MVALLPEYGEAAGPYGVRRLHHIQDRRNEELSACRVRGLLADSPSDEEDSDDGEEDQQDCDECGDDVAPLAQVTGGVESPVERIVVGR